tara:strand:+ start:2473 stop:2703 length:231 start_codon:yes stop_codon:yes gene_type:complete
MSEPWLEHGYDMDTYYREMHVAKKLKELEELKEVMNLVKERLITIDTSFASKHAKKHMIKNTIKLIKRTEKESIAL